MAGLKSHNRCCKLLFLCIEIVNCIAASTNISALVCGNSVKSIPSSSISDCNKPCSGDSTAVCGGDSRIQLYSLSFAGLDQISSLVSAKKSIYAGCFM